MATPRCYSLEDLITLNNLSGNVLGDMQDRFDATDRDVIVLGNLRAVFKSKDFKKKKHQINSWRIWDRVLEDSEMLQIHNFEIERYGF